MGIAYDDLKPRPSSFTLGDSRFELKPFSLAAQVWANSEFAEPGKRNGCEKLAELMTDITNLQVNMKVTHYLLKDKKTFPTVESLIDALERYPSEQKYEKIVEIYQAVVECMGVSQPMIEDIEQEIEAKKHAATMSEK